MTDAARAKVTLIPSNFVKTDSTKPDYLLEVGLDNENWHAQVNLVFIFVKEGPSYKQKFAWQGWGKAYFSEPELIDIDSDRRSEILIEADFSSSGATTNEVDIWKFIDTGFVNIFHEDLELSSSIPYGYHNKYRFVRNPRDSLLSDIEFTVDAGIQGTDAEEFTPEQYKNPYGEYPPNPIRKKVLFTFNGIRYTPNEPVPDYHAFLRRRERLRAK